MPGCELNLAYRDAAFRGMISEGSCPNQWGGASYVTSTIGIGEEQIVSFNRGWDDTGKQVWGPEEGGYILERLRP